MKIVVIFASFCVNEYNFGACTTYLLECFTCNATYKDTSQGR